MGDAYNHLRHEDELDRLYWEEKDFQKLDLIVDTWLAELANLGYSEEKVNKLSSDERSLLIDAYNEGKLEEAVARLPQRLSRINRLPSCENTKTK